MLSPDSTAPTPRNIKQVIVIRHDLHMRLGKAIAQGAHASMLFLIEHLREGTAINETEIEWLHRGMSKICVRVDSEAELLDIVEKARAAGIKTQVVRDAGRTEFHGVPTLTCCALGPDDAAGIDGITGHLKLL